jgi:ribonucleoside-diphosphate reductase alpha chain
MKKNITAFDFSEPVRNISWSTFGPCGSISIIADNCSSGIEPVFTFEYSRKSLGETYKLLHYPIYKWLSENKPEDLSLTAEEIKEKYFYREAYDILPKLRLKIQSIIQKYTTDSISSTLNLPNKYTVEDVFDIIMTGWKLKLKGLTIFRENSELAGIFEKKKDKKEEMIEMPEEADAVRHIVKWQGKKVYINVSLDVKGKVFEILASVPKAAGMTENGVYIKDLYLERMSYWHAICRLISVSLQEGTPITRIVKHLDDSSFSLNHLTSNISEILKKYTNIKYEKCPSCGNMSLAKESGCATCINCGYSLCEHS